MAVLNDKQTTIIYNCACEPEVIDFINFLNACGADIELVSVRQILIRGVRELHPTEWQIISDRIEILTYICLSAVLKNNITIQSCRSIPF